MRSIVEQSFEDWVSQIEQFHLKIDGIFFVCDLAGVVLRAYPDPAQHPDRAISEMVHPGFSWQEEKLGANAMQASLRSLQAEHVRASEHTDPRLQSYDTLAVPIQSDDPSAQVMLGWIVKAETYQQPAAMLINVAIAFRSSLQLHAGRRAHAGRRSIEKEARQQEMLFQMARSFHSCNDAESVLEQMMNILNRIYPAMKVEFYLSQDFHHLKFPFKPLLLQPHDDDLCARAFMDGELRFATDEESGKSAIAVPLSGKQAVYGVVHIQADADRFGFGDGKKNLQFLSMLADSAGIAFENARLFEQSNRLIDELRLINEIVRRLNQSLHIQDVFQYASEELIRIFAADYGCILKFEEEQNRLVVQSGNISTLIRESFPDDYGFSGLVLRTKEPIIVSDYRTERKVESKMMEITGSRSLVASPIVAGGTAIGAIMLTHRESQYFTYDNYRLLRNLSGHIGLALTNATLHDEVKKMAITDRLTGLFIRHHLDEQIRQKQQSDTSGSLILADIDHFKKVNDTYGHQIGDKILQQVARVLLNGIRKQDIAARWGGEELAIYMPHVRLEQAVSVAERLRASVSRLTDPSVTISCGLAQWKQGDDKVSVEQLYYRADMALYRAKNEGRNRVIVDDELQDS